MIPRSVKAWLFLYGLFFGSALGAISGILAVDSDIGLYFLVVLIMGSGLGLTLIEWRKGEVLKKWVPTEHDTNIIQILKEIVGRDKNDKATD